MTNIDDEQSTSGKIEREKPAQEKCRKEIDNLKGQLASLLSLKNLGMSLVTSKQINDAKKKLHDQEMLLKSKNFNMFFVDYQYKRAL